MSQGKKQYSYLYAFLKPIVRFAITAFYRRFEISGLDKIPRDKPLIFVSNHQNALMDPLLCCVAAPGQIGFLARADVFKNPAVAKVLNNIHMLPVYRAHDNVTDRRSENARVFQKCFDKLRRGNAIALFPEGNHSNQRKLRTLRKGVARIALGAQDEAPLDVRIVPVGIHYSNFDKFRSDVLVEYGEPISVMDIGDRHGIDSPQASNELMNRIQMGVSSKMVDLQHGEMTPTADVLASILIADSSNGKPRSVDVGIQFSLFKSVERLLNGPEENWKNLLGKWQSIEPKRAPWVMAREVHGNFPFALWFFLMIIGAPIALLGATLSFIPYLVIDFLTPYLIEDEQFKSSIKLLLGIFLFPLFWILTAGFLAAGISPWFWLIPLVALPLGLLAMNYVKMCEYLRRALLWKSWKRKNSGKANQLIEVYKELSKLLYQNYVNS